MVPDSPTSRDADHRAPLRREPPRFRRATVAAVEDLGPRMRRVTVSGPELTGFEPPEPAASVRVLLPDLGGRVTIPTWTGNQFETADGERAPIRTFTPRFHRPDHDELVIDVVRHGAGAAGTWVENVEVGSEVAVSGPGRGYSLPADLREIFLAGDESALPAMSQLLEALKPTVAVTVLVEVADSTGRLDLPDHPNAHVEWVINSPDAEPGTAMAEALEARPHLPPVLWVAGEAAAVQRLRGHLFEQRGLSRSAATVRGYWKKGRSAT